MLKFIFFALSFFNFGFNNNYQVVSEEADDLKNVAFYEDNIYLEFIGEKDYLLYLKGHMFNIQAELVNGIINEDKFYLVKYIGSQVFLIEYTYDGRCENELLIYQGNITSDLFLKVINGIVYCGFTEYYNEQYNITLVYIDCESNNPFIEEHHYGGNKNEKLIAMEKSNNSLYFLVQKDQITESCFGNGGSDNCYVIARIEDLIVKEYITINITDEFNYFCYRDGYIYCVINNKIYLFNEEMKLLNTLELDGLQNIFVGYNKNIIVFYKDKIEILNSLSLVKLDTLDIEGISNYKEFSKVLYCKYFDNYYIFDIVDYSKTLFIDNYIYEYDELIDERKKKVSSLFGECIFKDKEFLEYYQRNAFGTYHVQWKYQTVGGIDVIKEAIEEVPLEININNNMIYPNGYRIIFNGEGYLDGNQILSNHAVINDGYHELLIKGINVEQEFNFYISKNQYELTDNYFKEEMKNIKIGEEYQIIYNLNQDIEIQEISIIGGEIKDYVINNQELKITLKEFDTVGVYNIILEKIIFKKDYYTDEIYLNKVIKFNVYDSKISFNDVLISDDCSCSIEYFDNLKQARYIELYFVNQHNDKLYTFPIGEQNIDISGLESGTYQMIVSLCYDNMRNQIEHHEIYRMVVEMNEEMMIGETKLFFEEDGFNKLKINIHNNFKEENILELKDDNKLIYSAQEFKKESLISYSSIFFVVFLILGICLRFLYYRKNKA